MSNQRSIETTCIQGGWQPEKVITIPIYSMRKFRFQAKQCSWRKHGLRLETLVFLL